MFGTIRKHQTWLWVVIIIAVSAGMLLLFVETDVLSAFGARQAARGEFGSINGKAIGQTEFYEAYRETRLQEFMRSGKWPGNEEAVSRMLERQAANRVYIIHKMREMSIEPSDKAIGLMTQEHLHDYPYQAFIQTYLQPNGLTAADYERYVRHEAGIRQLVATAAVSARFVNPKEAETLWKKENQEIDTKVALFSPSNYLSQVVISNGALENFYTNRQTLYRLPERTVLSYLAFAATNFLVEADQVIALRTNINDQVNEFYLRGGTNVWKDTNGVPMPEVEAKAKIREELRLSEARAIARRAAAQFGTELMNLPEPNKLPTLEKLAADKKYVIHNTQPFDHQNGLDEFKDERMPVTRGEEEETVSFVQTLRQKALTLTDERPILFNAIPGYNAVYMIALKGKIPSELQSFETVKTKLTDDYKNFMAQDMARKAGMTFHTNLTNGLALKKSFDEIAKADKVLVIDVPPFSPSTRSLTNLDSRINLRLLQNFVGTLEVGQASPFIPQGGLIIYVAARPPIDEKKMAAEMDEFMGTLRQVRQSDAFNNWFRRQADKDRLQGPPQRDSAISAAN
jgi:hypothetical protein